MAPVGVKWLRSEHQCWSDVWPKTSSGDTVYGEGVAVLQPHNDKQTELASMTRANWIEPVAWSRR